MIQIDQPNIANLPGVRHIGKPLPRIDAMGKVTGTTKYAGDYTMPNMLYASVLRSKFASTTIVRVDAAKTHALDGVVTVLTAQDLPGTQVATDIPGVTGMQNEQEPTAHILASDRVPFSRRSDSHCRRRDIGHRRPSARFD